MWCSLNKTSISSIKNCFPFKRDLGSTNLSTQAQVLPETKWRRTFPLLMNKLICPVSHQDGFWTNPKAGGRTTLGCWKKYSNEGKKNYHKQTEKPTPHPQKSPTKRKQPPTKKKTKNQITTTTPKIKQTTKKTQTKMQQKDPQTTNLAFVKKLQS